MDLKGSLVDCKIKIYPSEELEKYIKCIIITDDTPHNILKVAKGDKNLNKKQEDCVERKQVFFTNNDIKNLSKIKTLMDKVDKYSDETNSDKFENLHEENEINQNLENSDHNEDESNEEKTKDDDLNDENSKESGLNNEKPIESDLNEEKLIEDDLKDKIYLNTDDIDWLYTYISKKREEGAQQVPYLHELFEGSQIVLPENQILKRNPILEARCVKLRAQQEAREYRKMTKGVDNVRMRFPEDSISYQMKQLNRQLIAIGQFIISIFAGFLFGFRGVEWMVGNLDFGFRLLLGVMCALVIALAEIYFLAKKLNEELNVPETVQLGGPPKFVEEPYFGYKNNDVVKKEHQD